MCIYARCNVERKRKLWDDLRERKSISSNSIWCIAGDFNSVRRVNERQGASVGIGDARHVNDFNQFISNMDLDDLQVVGRSFTWYRPNGSARSKLDRFLVSPDWLSVWPNSSQHILQRDISDHCPILLKNASVDWGLKPFQTFDCWLDDSLFRETVVKAWRECQICGWGAFVLKEKLKVMKREIKEWRKKHFDFSQTEINKVVDKMNDLDKKEEKGEETEEDKKYKMELQEEF
ncbi:uncharacterized protein LOC109808299 [Cajanus cajan]|uniref:uncharacterized protein LOC109808299 n=1 Tax=Cajanus cajan TaxID=3821 RepID=UPI00098DC062|nr:uncharacterized protein LOC109808299 [Cajanus cajan]